MKTQCRHSNSANEGDKDVPITVNTPSDKRQPTATTKWQNTDIQRCKPSNRSLSRCQICKRRPGTKKIDRFGNPDPNPQTPLGPLQQCESCGLWVCPDCWHEADCCFRDEAEHEDDPNWAPPGWKRIGDEWIRE